jgi:sugar O-acyltransferase (sialic acid O-acetyltransferase NeuD family)
VAVSPDRVVIWGGTGAAKEVRPIIEHCGARVVAVFDDTPGLESPFPGIPIYYGWDAFVAWLQTQHGGALGFCIAIGNPHGRVRLRLHAQIEMQGLSPVTVLHPSAVVERDLIIGSGSQVLAGAVIDVSVRIGRQCIVNLHSLIGHDSEMGDGSEVGPGATVCGNVTLGENAWVGAGSTVLPRIRIGQDAVVGAGSVVMRDVPDGVTVLGSPARVVKCAGIKGEAIQLIGGSL